jgi:hypothetical protein
VSTTCIEDRPAEEGKLVRFTAQHSGRIPVKAAAGVKKLFDGTIKEISLLKHKIVLEKK